MSSAQQAADAAGRRSGSGADFAGVTRAHLTLAGAIALRIHCLGGIDAAPFLTWAARQLPNRRLVLLTGAADSPRLAGMATLRLGPGAAVQLDAAAIAAAIDRLPDLADLILIILDTRVDTQSTY